MKKHLQLWDEAVEHVLAQNRAHILIVEAEEIETNLAAMCAERERLLDQWGSSAKDDALAERRAVIERFFGAVCSVPPSDTEHWRGRKKHAQKQKDEYAALNAKITLATARAAEVMEEINALQARPVPLPVMPCLYSSWRTWSRACVLIAALLLAALCSVLWA